MISLLNSPLAQSILSAILIGTLPVIILVFINVNNTPKHKKSLDIMLAFASGSLLADTFFHLIPHTFAKSGGFGPGFAILFGLYAFFATEKFICYFLGETISHVEEYSDSYVENGTNSKKARQRSFKKKVTPVEKKMTSQGYISFIGDFAHNITDGLAIGSSFMHSTSMGMTTSIAIMCHEIPHEIGDFAALVNANCSKRNAIFLQFISAIGAIIGTLMSFMLGNISTSIGDSLIPFTAGGFIYIGTVSMLGHLSADGCSSIRDIVKLICATVFGIVFMCLVGNFD